ncbi:hypothetical protein J2D73_19415 [Acetobacter sacchari]|uniref:Glycosyltransferase RgtA/B/C/D-like domain-containing protein n=1 Tax=Acetobacter sacchari TaxID=2661687 RepID=A0ABS3M1G6_9PROT|nr:hypothetical protein [Acetobacter sacchari]MBO1361955.1 hypothetical protein [Acetobacter sacchari]
MPWPCGRYPEGWWGWFDQSNYFKSTVALAHGDLRPEQHWYPFGYALIGAPFVWLGRQVYFLPDLICLLLAARGFISFARTCGVASTSAMLLFLLGTCSSHSIRSAWAEPWNTTLAAALIWNALALSAREISTIGNRCDTSAAREGALSLALLGAILAFMPVTRPTDVTLAGPIGLTTLGALYLQRGSIANKIVRSITLIGGCLLIWIACAALYLSIYGFHPTQYMIVSRNMGFRLEGLGWKTYILLLTPRPWFPDGAGLLERLPWIAPGLAGLIVAPFVADRKGRWVLALLSVLITGYSLLFFSYVDLIPAGLWRYNNVHYFKWLLPGLALLGFIACRALTGVNWRLAAAALAGVYLATCIRFLPYRTLPDAAPIWMVQKSEPPPSWPDAYFEHSVLHDNQQAWRNINDFRAMPDSQGERWIALRAPFSGIVRREQMKNGQAVAGTETLPDASSNELYWGMQLGFRLDPCWLPPYACSRKDPQP